MNPFASFVQHAGPSFYPIVATLTFFEGETVVALAGAAAACGAVHLAPLILAAWAGSFLGDQFWFALARRYGRGLASRLPGRLAGRVSRATELLERHHVAFILAYRFMYGMRNVASVALGASAVPWRRFAILNLAAAGAWATAFACGGFLAGRAVHGFLEWAGWAAAILPVAALPGWALRRALLRRRAPPPP